MKPLVFITRRIPDNGIKLLKNKNYRVKINPYDRVLKKKELIKMGKGSKALLSLLTDEIDEKVLDGIGAKLEIVANYAVGYDNIDLKACKKRGIKVTNTPGVLSGSVAEHTFALMAAITKRIVEENKFAKAGKYKGWAPKLFLSPLLAQKTLGIVGLGRIGKLVAKRACQGMDMKIVYYDIKRDKDFEKLYKAKYLSLKNLLKQSDVVSLHVPLLDNTFHLISKDELNLMKKTSYLINTSRGPVIDEDALFSALIKKSIAGAALDVFECEPKIACSKKWVSLIKKMDNLILTPHTASATIEARENMAEIAAKNIIACLENKKLISPIKIK
jgi:glyoxylate reductase